jgi:hypothetical protein
MLAEILKALEEADGPVDMNRLSRELDVERSALEGMLQTLVRQGKLREIEPGSQTCASCSRRSGCTYLKAGESGVKVYELTEKS